MTGLGKFEGSPVTAAGIEIPGAAGGLREALKVDPVNLPKGARVYVVLECEVGKIRFDPIDADHLDGAQRRVHVLRTEAATLVDRELVAGALEAQELRISEARELDGQLSITDAGA